jgi:methionyl aminopeptidase
MTVLTNIEDIEKIKSSGKLIKEVFSWLETSVRPGISTEQLDKDIEDIIRKSGGVPAFKGYKGFPSTICASVNNVVVHGIPTDEIVLDEGDIIGIDIGVRKEGFFTDAARTYTVGEVDGKTLSLIETTQKSLMAGIEKAVAGNRIGDISNAVQLVAEENGYKEVRMFVGHGVGRHLHEPPEIPNWGEKGTGPELKKGQVLAIEPMINMGTRDVRILADGWTAVTDDGLLSAHFEDTVIVGDIKAEIIT